MKKINFKLLNEKTGKSDEEVEIAVDEVKGIKEVKYELPEGGIIFATLLTKIDGSTILIKKSLFVVEHELNKLRIKWKKK